MEKSLCLRALASAIFAALLFCPPAALCWDDGGHLIVNEIAARRLHPAVAKEIEALLPPLDSRCSRGQGYNLTTAGTWMDDLRALGSEYEWAKYHYIDIPCSGPVPRITGNLKSESALPDQGDFVEPRPPHALWALDKDCAAIRTPNAKPEARAAAIARIMHIVADIHQPVHVATRNDRGGNGFPVVPFTSSGRPGNLHQFWDAAYRYGVSGNSVVELWSVPPNRPEEPNAPGIIAEEATRLLKEHPPESLPPLTGMPHAWIRATHNLACRDAWPTSEPPSGGAVELSPEFVERAHRIAETQLVLAGCRLADLLNGLLEAK